MKEYDKLIRDKIPEIIEASGRSCKTKVLSEEEYKAALNKKLQEELSEYLESGEVEELADLEEVLLAILDFNAISRTDFEKMRESKANERGGFKKRLCLLSVED